MGRKGPGALSLRQKIRKLEEYGYSLKMQFNGAVHQLEDMATWSLWRFWKWKKAVRKMEEQRLNEMERRARDAK